MKRFILPILFLAFMFPAISQNIVNLSGTVTDNGTGLPIPNQAVQITSDSSGGFFYFNVVSTDMNGFYLDSIPLNGSVTSGILFVTTIDCLGISHTSVAQFGPGNMSPVLNFQICSGTSCQAGFYYFPDSAGVMNTLQFIDLSIGNINSWYWDFGDGQYSNLQDPIHTYAQSGLYNVCLTIQGVDSLCYDTYCNVVNVGGQGGCQAQFTYYPDSLWSSRIIHFVDLSYGDITSWFWDFGDSTFSTEQNPSHLFPDEGTYYVCLTVIGNNANAICQSTWCEEVVVGTGSDCASYFTFQNNGLSISLAGHMINGQPAAFYWEFGDGQAGQGQNVIHQYPQSGIYFVTLTTVTQDPTGCTWSTAQSVSVGDSTQWNQLYGQVFAGNFPMELGIVMIFSLDTSATFVPFVDISVVDSFGVYYFPMVPLGNYLVYAIPFMPDGYLPTYYGDVLNWENATVISLGQPANPYNINLIQADSYLPGIGEINGQINTTGLKTTLVDKITMLLMNEAGQAITFSQVNDQGEFDFSELDYGIYYLKAEMAGCQSDYIKVELTPDHPIVDVVMTLSGNQILGTQEPAPVLEAGVVYPNPLRDQAQISVKLNEGSQVYIELYNLSGQRVYQQTNYLHAGTTTVTIPVSQFRDGLYTLRIYTHSGLNLTRKLLKSQ
ncbi:MAG: PKD domain-containing protein [Bacteroidota bacterium]